MRFYTIRFDSIHLTEDGTSGGTPCKLSVAGADALLRTRTGQTAQAADGTPYVQIVAFTSGKILEIQISTVLADVWADLTALVNTALENSATINLVGVGDIGDFNVNAQPLLPQPFEAQEFNNGRIKNATFRFITA